MCGIAGLLQRDSPVSAEVLARMSEALAHRGPDSSGLRVSSDGSAALAHRRLSILDLSARGSQPMTGEDGRFWVSYNGEIYNAPSLRVELEKLRHRFVSTSDTEVIVHAHEEWGDTAVGRLVGMFAYALWDEQDHRLLLVRDRVGIKPLFYYEDEYRFAFASELKAFRSLPSFQDTLDETALYDYLTYHYIPTPKTLFKHCRKLPPGHILAHQDGRSTLTRYWQLNWDRPSIRDPREAMDTVRQTLAQVVRDHMLADVPVGILLSGGMDSSAVAMLLHRAGAAPRAAFTMGFGLEGFDETPYAEQVAQMAGIPLQIGRIDVESARGLAARLPQLYDEPFGDTSALPTALLCRFAAQDLKVVLSGDGGDELFGGYHWYGQEAKARRLARVPPPLRRLASDLALKLHSPGLTGKRLYWAGLDEAERSVAFRGGLTRREKALILAPDVLHRFRDYDDTWYFRQNLNPDLDPLTRQQSLDFNTFLHDDILTKVDRSSMAWGLEVRVPLLDHRLAEKVASIAPSIRNPGGPGKGLFRAVLGDILPTTILNRPKRGFGAPMTHWSRQGFLSENTPQTDAPPRLAFPWPPLTVPSWFSEFQKWLVFSLRFWFTRVHG